MPLSYYEAQGRAVGAVKLAGSFYPNGVDAVDNTKNTGVGFTVARVPDTAATATLTFTANPTTADGVAITVGNITITSGTDFDLGATLPLTLDAMVEAYNDATDVNCTAAVSGTTKIIFTSVAVGTETNDYDSVQVTDTDSVFSFGATTMDGAADHNGEFVITLDDLWQEITAVHAWCNLKSAADMQCQVGAISESAGTIALRTQAGATGTDIAADDDNSVYINIFVRSSTVAA